MIECATRREMENNIDLYEDLLGMACMVDITNAYYEENMLREE